MTTNFKDFMMDSFTEVEIVEKEVMMGRRIKNLKLKPLTANEADKVRKKCTTTKSIRGMKETSLDHDKLNMMMITETIVEPNFKDAEFQKAWGVIGELNLLAAIKEKMLDSEYTDLVMLIEEVNGYNKSIEELKDIAKN
ncbi:MAG: hypothetical protein RR782_02675 [Clostridium sp.]